MKFGKTWPILRSASCNPGTDILGSGGRVMGGLVGGLGGRDVEDCHARCSGCHTVGFEA